MYQLAFLSSVAAYVYFDAGQYLLNQHFNNCPLWVAWFVGVWYDDVNWNYCWISWTHMTEQQLKLREETLGILLKKFGDTNNNRGIYECAEDWCSKQMTTAGLVSYYKAYYTKQLTR